MNKSSIADDFDLKTMALIIWHNKLILLGFFILSLIISAYSISQQDVVYRVEAVVDFNKNSEQKGSASLMPLAMNTMQQSAFLNLIEQPKMDKIPKLLGGEFLGLLVKESTMREKLKKFCVYGPPGTMSLTGMLQKFGLMKLNPVLESQQEQILVKCLKEALEIKEYKHNFTKTSAVIVGLRHSNPFSAASIVNETIDFFFEYENKANIDAHRKSLKFLSDILGEAELKKKKAKEAVEIYVLKNPEVRSIMKPENSGGVKNSLRSDIALTNQDLGDLSNLEKQIGELSNTIKYVDSLLSSQTAKEISELIKNEYNPFLSTELIKNLNTFKGSQKVRKDKINQINRILNNEKILLTNLLETFKNKKKEKKIQVSSSLQKKEKLESLELDLLRNQAFIESIKGAIQEKALNISFEGLVENAIYTRASPSFIPVKPRPKTTFIFFAVVFFMLGILFIFIIQSLRKIIYHENQLLTKSEGQVITRLSKSKDLNFKSLVFEERSVPFLDFNLLTKLNDAGNRGSVIHVGSNLFLTRDLSFDVSLFLSNLFLFNYKNPLLISKPNNIINKFLGFKNKSNRIKIAKIEEKIDDQKYISFTDDFKFTDENSGRYSVFDNNQFEKTVICPGVDIKDFEKLEIIKNTDFFVVVGLLGKVRESELMRFITGDSPIKNKCAGIILIG